MNNYKKIDACRISHSANLIDILNLGSQPLANSLKEKKETIEKKIPLSISFCKESSLVQLNETVDKNILFNHYIWVTGTSKTANIFAKKFADNLINLIQPNKEELILEIASNDGTFLKPFLEKGYNNILGIDPAKNIAKIANNRSINTLPEFWNSSLAEKILKDFGSAKIIFARNVIPHVSDILDVVNGIQIALSDDGVGAIEFHYSGNILNQLQYDSIYHEHLCYFSIESITYLLNIFNLIPFHVDESPISGGALIIYFSKAKKMRTNSLKNFLIEEKRLKINEYTSWNSFAKKTITHKKYTLDLLESMRTKKIIGFGSSARSQTYLNYCEVTDNHIDSIIDNNSMKIGQFAPGSSIPIVSFQDGIKRDPDIIFILAWNFKNEIIKECKNFGFRGQYLIPFPLKPYII